LVRGSCYNSFVPFIGASIAVFTRFRTRSAHREAGHFLRRKGSNGEASNQVVAELGKRNDDHKRFNYSAQCRWLDISSWRPDFEMRLRALEAAAGDKP
jgi:hypothetical protein